jgi:sulfatase maturation enzyme AslB (radical SAM superfamily)
MDTAKAVNSLPGSRFGRTIRKRIFTMNVEITGRCNASCTYCHFYATRNRKDVAYDMSDEQFKAYMLFAKHWINTIEGDVTFRFSGGDPIVMKEKLFARADEAFSITGVKPFILTHGKGMNATWVDKAKKSSINRVYVSIENPINPDKGAISPQKSIDNVKKLTSDELQILLGVCVVPVENYKDLLTICDWFFDNIGYIPPIAEINYDYYTPPTEKQWSDLEENINAVLSKYHGKTYLNLFHSVSPELSYNGNDPYVFSLDLKNKYGITTENYITKIDEVINELNNLNYPMLNCKNTNCDWWEFCDNTKWYWQGDKKHTKSKKLIDYCRFKRILNDAYYRNVVDKSYIGNQVGIENFI